MNFSVIVFNKIIKDFANNHFDNWDYARFGKERKTSLKVKLKFFVSKFLYSLGIIRVNDIRSALSILDREIHHYEYLHSILANQQSKDLLINVLVYRILGYKRVKLPHNNTDYWSKLRALNDLAEKDNFIDPHFSNFILYKHNLQKIGYPIQLYFTALGVMIDFVLKQYEYSQDGFTIKAEPGDLVIDGGGCWGDTALFFSHFVGSKGKVYSFEFIPFNLELFRKNTELNPHLLSSIEVVQSPLWVDSKTKIYYKDKGPASNVKMEKFEGYSGEANTISVDDFAQAKQLERIDFIKLDIEGAELSALKGAVNSIRKFKPKIAVALYHYQHDFDTIPRFINELNLGYKFYLSHCTMNKEETILFAITEK